jgi:hypothetical protein
MPDLVYNRHGNLVRKAVQRVPVHPLIRFFDSFDEVDTGLPAPCWLWQSKRGGEPMIRISERLRKRPWRYAFELFHGVFVPSGANWKWHCQNPSLCCQPEHLETIGTYCQDRVFSGGLKD